VIRVPGTKSRGEPIAYLREYGEFVWRCRQLLARHRAFADVRVVHVHTLPDFLIWAARPAQRRGARVILDLHEIFPEFAATKYRVAAALVTPLARSIERWARRRATV